MEKSSARGYALEVVVLKLLKQFGYIDVKNEEVRGRGASHQIDAYGVLSIPTAFIYPIRLFCECKYYTSTNIGLDKIRSFVGVIKDISENYIVYNDGLKNVDNRYTDSGAFFSISQFTIDAQNYAWAQNIFLVSLNSVPYLKPIINDIKEYVDRIDTSNLSIDKLKDDYERHLEENNIIDISFAIGIIDNIYPVAIIGKTNWLYEIDNGEYIYKAIKTRRVDKEDSTLFELNIRNKKVYFSLPNLLAKNIKEKVDNNLFEDEIFQITIPFLDYRNIPRIIKILVYLEDKDEYLYNIKGYAYQERALDYLEKKYGIIKRDYKLRGKGTNVIFDGAIDKNEKLRVFEIKYNSIDLKGTNNLLDNAVTRLHYLERNNIHLEYNIIITFVFIGDITSEIMEEIKRRLDYSKDKFNLEYEFISTCHL